MHSAPAWECRLGRSASSARSAMRTAAEDAERPGRHSHGGPWERVWRAPKARERSCARSSRKFQRSFVRPKIVQSYLVALRSGTSNSVASIHVPTPSVDIAVDDAMYRVETFQDSPLVCQLRPGNHVLRMSQDGQTLFEQEFKFDRGEEIVLTARDERPSEPRTTSLAAVPSRSKGRSPKKSKKG